MMKNTMMICLALFAAFGCTGQSKAGKGKTQELTTMENQKEIYLAGGCFWGTEHFMKQIRLCKQYPCRSGLPAGM